MTETLLLSQPSEAEVLPQDLVFERFDGHGSGIADLPHGGYVVEVGEQLSRVKNGEGKLQRDDLSHIIDFIKAEPEIAAWYGYEHIPSEDGGLARVVFPSLERLNARKNSLPAELGINRAIFQSQEGSKFGPDEYLGMLGESVVPIATELDMKAHDLCAHTAGFAIMSAELFDFLSAAARNALVRSDWFAKDFRGDITGMIDQVSGWLNQYPSSRSTTSPIGMVHDAQWMSKSEAAQVITALQESQLRANDALREYVRSQNAEQPGL